MGDVHELRKFGAKERRLTSTLFALDVSMQTGTTNGEAALFLAVEEIGTLGLVVGTKHYGRHEDELRQSGAVLRHMQLTSHCKLVAPLIGQLSQVDRDEVALTTFTALSDLGRANVVYERLSAMSTALGFVGALHGLHGCYEALAAFHECGVLGLRLDATSVSLRDDKKAPLCLRVVAGAWVLSVSFWSPMF